MTLNIKEKKCIRCNSTFKPASYYVVSYCPPCFNKYRKERRDKGFGILSPDEKRDANLRRNYGITLEQYNQMLAEQNGVCAICKVPETRINYHTKKTDPLLVDHCHNTGKVRGLLCVRCNSSLGFMKEDLELIEALSRYVAERCLLDEISETP